MLAVLKGAGLYVQSGLQRAQDGKKLPFNENKDLKYKASQCYKSLAL